MLHEKTFDTDQGKVVHISDDKIRYYPKWMVEELATQHDVKIKDVLADMRGMDK